LNTSAKIAAAILTCFACLVFNMLAWTFWNPTFVQNDGVQYLSTAFNWLEGRGLSTNALMYKPHFQGYLPAPQTVWPPGYPLLIALTSLLGMHTQTAALLLNLIFLVASALLTFVILRRCYIKFSRAMFCTVIFYFTALPWIYSFGLLTEPVFSTLILATIAVLPDPEKDRIWPWLVSGILLALVVSVRYSGVFFAMGVGAGIFSYLAIVFRHDTKRFFRGVTLLGMLISISVACFVALRYRAYLLTGTFRRETGSVEPPDGLTETFMQIAWQSRRLLGFIEGGIESTVVIKIMTVIFAVLLIYVFVQSIYVVIRSTNKSVKTGRGQHRVMYFAIFGHTVVFIIYFSITSVITSTVELNDRYIYQIYPGLYILFCVLVSVSIDTMIARYGDGLTHWFRGSVVALLCLFMIAQVNLIAGIQYYAKPGVRSIETLSLQKTEEQDLRGVIESCFLKSDEMKGTLWSNDSQLLHFNTSIPTVTTSEGYSENHNGFDVIAEQILMYDIKMFIFLNGMPDVSPQHIEFMANLKQWLVQQGHVQAAMLERQISDGISVDVFVVDENCLK